MSTTMEVKAVANWFGSSRMVADRIGPHLAGCSLVVVPFAGGMAELPHFDAAKLLVNDLHKHVINMAAVMADDVLGLKLYRQLRRATFDADTLARAQDRCKAREYRNRLTADLFGGGVADARVVPDLDWAADYFIASWMARGGNSGTRNEFGGGLPVRYSPNGGGSAQRFHNAVKGIPAWRRVLRRCEFVSDDAFNVLAKCHDSPKTGIYCDAPWPDAGDGYTNAFTEDDQRNLAAVLASFRAARVVVRFADHPLIRELYPESRWTWHTYPSRTQHNGSFNEVLLSGGAA